MMQYTVFKPMNTDAEFQAYVALLREKNVDVSRLERVREKGSDRKWLYAWPTPELAEQFAQELRNRTRDNSWRVVEFEPEPVRGIEIEVVRGDDGMTFRLSQSSLARIKSTYPSIIRSQAFSLRTILWPTMSGSTDRLRTRL